MADWEDRLARWQADGVLDAAAAERIRAWEALHGETPRTRWPAAMLWSLGGVLLGAGVLLFVAAHWEDLGPDARFGLVLAMVAGFHLGAVAAVASYPGLATVLHAVGTVTLGAGVFLAGQIFNLQEHWPGGILLWAVGAAVGFGVLRDGPQTALLAVLAPAWLIAEWSVAIDDRSAAFLWRPVGVGIATLATVYASAVPPGGADVRRRTLARIGSSALLPAAAAVVILGSEVGYSSLDPDSAQAVLSVGWAAAIVLPLALAVLLRGSAAWVHVVVVLWAVLVSGPWMVGQDVERYLLCGLGAVGLTWWGLQDRHAARVNAGVAGFALTVLAFYFSSVMDRLDRSLSLIGLGVLFIGGGWALERMRRRLLAGLREGAR